MRKHILFFLVFVIAITNILFRVEMVFLRTSTKIISSRIKIIFKRIFFVLIFLCGVCIIFFGSSRISKTIQRANDLEETTATVVSIGTEIQNDKKDGSKQKRCHFPVAQYFVDNRLYSVNLNEYNYSDDEEFEHDVGSSIIVKYDPWDPADCVLPDESGKIIRVHIIEYVCSGFIVVLGILVSFLGIRKLIKNFKRENLNEVVVG